MSNFQALVENAFSVEGLLDDSGTDARMERFAHWLRICAAGIAAVTAGGAAWLELTAATVVLHSNEVGMSASEKESMRRSMLTQLFKTERSCYGLIRMSPTTFNLLCEKLIATTRLHSYAHTSAEEQVAIFLFIVGQKFSNRAVSFLVHRSGESCSRYFQNVLHALVSLVAELVKQPNEHDLSSVISQSARFYPFFKDCLGALDGTHVRVKVPKIDAARYRGRKDVTTQNVLATCTFDLRFTYILAGWEGSASDSTVLKSALSRHDPLLIPNGKYYLGDSGFGLSTKILVPYGRTRYHLKEYAIRGPQNAQELFNLRHASLRNCIERCFGILKKRFPIISTGAECQYSSEKMIKIILACCVLHNYLIATEPEHALIDSSEVGTDSRIDGIIADGCCGSRDAGMDYAQGKSVCDAIAEEMKNLYRTENISLQNIPSS